MSIAPTPTVTQLLRLRPAALPVLTTAGIDTCLTFDQLAALAAGFRRFRGPGLAVLRLRAKGGVRWTGPSSCS